MIQCTQRGVTIVRGAAWDAAKRTFADRHFVVLPRFVEDSLLDRLVRQIAKAVFYEQHTVGGREQTMAEAGRVPWLFWRLLNRRDVFAAMQELVDTCNDTFGARCDGDRQVRSFRTGRCFKQVQERGTKFFWHDDCGDGRLIGLTVDLAEGAGGGIEIGYTRRQVARHPLVGQATPGFGGAVLFRIAKGLAHRSLLGAGTVPRCTFSGWFSNSLDHLPPRLFGNKASGV